MLAKADRDDHYQIAARHLHIKDNHDPVDHVEMIWMIKQFQSLVSTFGKKPAGTTRAKC